MSVQNFFTYKLIQFENSKHFCRDIQDGNGKFGDDTKDEEERSGSIQQVQICLKKHNNQRLISNTFVFQIGEKTFLR